MTKLEDRSTYFASRSQKHDCFHGDSEFEVKASEQWATRQARGSDAGSGESRINILVAKHDRPQCCIASSRPRRLSSSTQATKQSAEQHGERVKQEFS